MATFSVNGKWPQLWIVLAGLLADVMALLVRGLCMYALHFLCARIMAGAAVAGACLHID